MPQVSEIDVKDALGVTKQVATITALLAVMGEVQNAPSANTVLARLKAIAETTDGLEALISSLNSLIAAPTPAGTNLVGGVTPQFSSGGNASQLSHATGTNFAAFGNLACKQLTIVNDTGVTIEFQQGGSGVSLPIKTDQSFTVFGISNANQIGIRRVDQSNTQVTVKARWEA